jgi:hypothetical protein
MTKRRAVYVPRAIKRPRASRNQVEERRAALWQIVAGGRPMTVRQVFYQTSVHGIVPKTEQGNAMVKTDLTIMRRTGG